MTGWKPNRYWTLCWAIIAPFVMGVRSFLIHFYDYCCPCFFDMQCRRLIGSLWDSINMITISD
jgi:hypothetical protein